MFKGITDTYTKEVRYSKSSISNVYEYPPEGIYVWKINTHARVLRSHIHVLFFKCPGKITILNRWFCHERHLQRSRMTYKKAKVDWICGYYISRKTVSKKVETASRFSSTSIDDIVFFLGILHFTYDSSFGF